MVDAAFFAEVRESNQLPAEGPPEVAIAGRSNVGKSTLLNRLAGRRALARSSKTPGRTRGLVFYDLTVRPPDAGPMALRLVDFPGYGYAQVAHDERKRWRSLVEGYVRGRTALALFLVLVDARREIADEERQLVAWLAAVRVPYALVITKIDKVGRSRQGLLHGQFRAALPPGALPTKLVSGATGEGVADLLHAIVHACSSGGPPI